MSRRLASRATSLALCAVCVCGCASPPPPWRTARAQILDAYLHAPDPKPVLVVDIDDTLVKSGFWCSVRLLLGIRSSSFPSFPEAPECLRRLRDDWDLVLLTSRDDRFERRTLAWLDRQGFPALPVVFSRSLLATKDRREEFKSLVLADLKRRGLRISCGIGDKATDIAAYRQNGLRSILLLDGPGDPDYDATLGRLKVGSLCRDRPWENPLELVTFRREDAWPRIAKYLIIQRS